MIQMQQQNLFWMQFSQQFPILQVSSKSFT